VNERLEAVRLPDEEAAEERAWRVVRAAVAEREPLPRRRLALVPALAALVVVALVVAALTPPGRAVIDSVRDAIGVEEAAPALVALPSPGRLLVVSPQGPWIVRQDGSKRLLGAWDDASWSPRGLFVVASRGRRLAALDPRGRVRWSLARPERVRDARWSPDGFRIAYRAGTNLRVVAGDGTGDHLLATLTVRAPAWRPGAAHVLAYADRFGIVHVVDADGGAELWRTDRPVWARGLEWSDDGTRLLALTDDGLRIYSGAGRTLARVRGSVSAAVFRPASRDVAYATEASVVLRREAGGTRVLFRGAGRFDELAWSPNGRWLLVPWPEADQWVFVRPAAPRIAAVSDIAGEFSPGGAADPTFPRVAGWVPG
jgi:hypothetical protein